MEREQRETRPELNEVWRERKTGYKKVISLSNIEKISSNLSDYDYVGDGPHFDGDYSYICGWEYCRCLQ